MDAPNLPKDRIDRYDRGVTRLEIVKYLLRYEDGVKEPNIRRFLQEELGISGLRGIKLHLEKLESEKILKKTSESGGPNIWVLNYDMGFPLGKFLVDEIFLPLSLNRDLDESFCSLFKTPAIMRYVISCEQNMWAECIFHYLRLTKEVNFNNASKDLKSFFLIFWQSLTTSPSLFIEMFYQGNTLYALATLIEYYLKKEGTEYNFYNDEYLSLFLAPMYFDYLKHIPLQNDISGHILDRSMKFPFLKNVDCIFKKLILLNHSFSKSIISRAELELIK